MSEGNSTAVIQRYLDDLAEDSLAEPIIRALLDRAVRRLHPLCASLLYRSYPRLTQPPFNLQTEELLSSAVRTAAQGHARSASPTVRQFFAPGQPAHALGAE